ncbi:MAG: hypothetical protein ACLT76_13810 [Clostridium fessum]
MTDRETAIRETVTAREAAAIRETVTAREADGYQGNRDGQRSAWLSGKP